ncbi:hypothetical protein AFR_16195 [Actinoplanes friuliensis DSM 7358]|uniref:Bulb-type lectin domain-containing protein n=1 Tax=Actinoplanes friuliensis DSM 7358 TaxID=1246995 RepID=U5W0P7_9ACTN|nr:hypothetical protein AFR_16195 [Actinoplanes friuliensis DSM 7358]
MAAAGVVTALLTGTAVVTAGPAQAASADRLTPGRTLTPGAELRSANQRYRLVMQTDGNAVVMTAGGTPLWSSDTPGYGGAALEMQNDGNLVLYKSGHVALKASGTAGRQSASLVLQDDGNLVVYTSDGRPWWSTNTSGGAKAPAPTGARLCARVGYYAGFREQGLQLAVQVALAESGCNPAATNRNTNNSVDYGLWQVNNRAHPQWTPSQLLDPQTNANAAWSISGRGGNWRPWVAYTSGAHTRNGIPAKANAAVTQL